MADIKQVIWDVYGENYSRHVVARRAFFSLDTVNPKADLEVVREVAEERETERQRDRETLREIQTERYNERETKRETKSGVFVICGNVLDCAEL